MKNSMLRSAALLLATSFLVLSCDRTEKPDPRAENEDTSPSSDAAAAPAPARASTPAPAPVARGDVAEEKIAKQCTALCETTSSMPCVKVGPCTATCMESFGQPFCRAEFDAMLTCSASSPASQFECGEEGSPILKEEACAAEQEAAATCVMAVMQQGAGTANP